MKAIYSIDPFSFTIYFCSILPPFIHVTYIKYIVVYKIKFLNYSTPPSPLSVHIKYIDMYI